MDLVRSVSGFCGQQTLRGTNRTAWLANTTSPQEPRLTLTLSRGAPVEATGQRFKRGKERNARGRPSSGSCHDEKLVAKFLSKTLQIGHRVTRISFTLVRYLTPTGNRD